MNKVFIVEDDEVIIEQLANHLSMWQMDVTTVKDFQNVAGEVEVAGPDIILMDINLPYFNGFYWCSEIRKFSKVPIVFLSSASDNMNIVMAMNMGGDDFISKPFDLNVLTAKLQAMLRRAYGMDLTKKTLECRGVVLDLDNNSAQVNNEKLELTKNEFLILKILFEKKGKIVSREDIMDVLWGDDEFVDDNTLTVNMTRIRKKLEAMGVCDIVSTKRGLGYLVNE